MPEDVRVKPLEEPAHECADWGTCYFCGREITARHPLMIWVVGGGDGLVNFTDLYEGGPEKTEPRCDKIRADGGSVGWWTVGPDCARKRGLLPDYADEQNEEE